MTFNKQFLFSSFLACFLFSGFVSAPGPADCEVLTEALQGSYEGECKKGVANGAGKAVGTDTYEGEFKKGLPHGDGVYTWANGDVFKGEFSKGLKEGEGLLTFADDKPTLKGYWIEDEYIGTEKTPYKVINKSVSANRVSFRRIAAQPSQMEFKFTRLGKPVKCRSLTLQGSYGVIMSENEFSKVVEVYSYPMQGAILFSAMQTRDVAGGNNGDFVEGNMEFSINQGGSWEITIEIQPE